ncbi:tol-pal system protein YbgF [uncultured Castellaniella sp.]|uniref:tol-pal system protein YbgF n=1 Tax=uncultured Castellaniella sp. TaxID=647907 RepID=UPI00260DFDAC|nr:tol-pal system protein YbgF [uncultured Castellaniella sp.]
MHAPTHRLNALPAAALLALALTAPAAHAFTDDEARRAILELRTQIQQMKDQNQQARLQLADQMDMLHQEIATLRGRMEELNQLNRNAAAPGQGNAPQQQTPQSGDPQQQAAYEAAADQYRNGRYKEAASSFATFVQSYPDSEQATDAQFYLGSSQYASKDFKNSIQTMQSLVKSHPDDARAPDALLVVAADQIELNDMKGAKASLQRIIKDYPKSSAAETAKSRLKLL